MSYKEGIVEAITELKKRNGSSKNAIKKVMEAKLPADKVWQNGVFLKALQNGVEMGEFVKIKNSYKLSADFLRAAQANKEAAQGGKKKTKKNGNQLVRQRKETPADAAPNTSQEEEEEEEGCIPEDGSPEDDEDEVSVVHAKIASCSCTIVGIRYYTGTAHAGEYVTLVREPANPYDRNAVRIDNMAGQKVGHIKREQAAILAPFLDRADSNGLTIEGTIPRPGNAWNMLCSVDFLASAPAEELEERAVALAEQLEDAFGRLYSFQNLMARKPAASARAAAPPKVESKRIDWASQAKELDELFEQQTAQQLQNLPDLAMPPQLETELLPYQKEGLQWLVHHDTTPKMPFYSQRTENSQQVWHCSISKSSQPNPPEAFQGGILADQMGLGKTLQIISLLLAAPPSVDNAMLAPQCTLIVCPVSVMANWSAQIEEHVEPGVLNVGLYQGTNRAAQCLPKIQDGSINVLLVSYPTLASEYKKIFGDDKQQSKKKKKKKRVESIFDHEFHRLVLDEAHNIRNPRARTFQAVNQLKARRKWCLTGTPFVNQSQDIYALLHFLGVSPLNDKKIFQRAVTIPMEQGDDLGLACLRVAMAHVALRRSKESAKIELPEKTVLLQKVSFPDQSPHATVYNALFGTVRTAFQAVLQDDGDNRVLSNYTNIFEKLLRLRQACCSAHLVPAERRERALELWKELQNRANGSSSEQPKLTTKEGLELLERLKGAFTEASAADELPECAVCLMEMEESQCIILRTCSHVYCEPCIERVCATGKYNNPNCPLCRQPFEKKDMIKKSMASIAVVTQDNNNKDKDQEVAIDNDSLGASPKILTLLETIKTTMKPDEKGVIFSQFTSFLDLIEAALKEAGYSYTRLDGSMNTTKRIEAVKAFSSEELGSPRFILCSLHAAGTGINLTRGSAAFMMDCWWNTAVENQAMDRIHRIGQTRSVCVHRFVMKDSLEERIVALQEVKSMQAKGAMQKLKPEEKRMSRLGDLKGLLMIEDESD